MEFSNQVPMGELDPRIRTNDTVIYHTSIEVKVYDQEDKLAGWSWNDGEFSVPRWTHTFTGKGSAVYKPADGDSRRYKAKVIVNTVERDRTSETAWGPETKSERWATIDYLKDGGQVIAIVPRDGAPRVVALRSSVSGPGPSLFAGGGTLYRVNGDGNLVRYHHDASGTFSDYNGQVIGWGWGGMRSIHAVRDGALYTISPDGTLRYYRHNDAGAWDDVNGRSIGSHWAGFSWVGAGRFGQLYAINSGGDLLYYQHDGNFNWTISGAKIGNAWPTTGVFVGGANCLYIITPSGELLYYYHDDARNWVHAGLSIGTGWGALSPIASSGNGEIYGVAPTGDLLFYRHDVAKKFIAGSGQAIGWGWSSPGPHGLLAAAR